MPQSHLYQSRTIQCVRDCVSIRLYTCANVCSRFVIAGTAGVDDIEFSVAAAAPRRLLWAEEKQRPDIGLELGSGDGAPSYITCRSRLRPATFLALSRVIEEKQSPPRSSEQRVAMSSIFESGKERAEGKMWPRGEWRRRFLHRAGMIGRSR
jgi:hypothetical protein